METYNLFSECTQKEMVCEHFELGRSSTSTLNLRKRLPLNLTYSCDRQFSESRGWLSLRQTSSSYIWHFSFFSYKAALYVYTTAPRLTTVQLGGTQTFSGPDEAINHVQLCAGGQAERIKKEAFPLKHSSSWGLFPPHLWLQVLWRCQKPSRTVRTGKDFQIVVCSANVTCPTPSL